jgi:enoyl-[acyl-carrier-protein] reductase (NADH)
MATRTALTVLAERDGILRQAAEEQVAQGALLKRLPRLREVGAAAALMASDQASAVTGTVMNVTCGAVMD